MSEDRQIKPHSRQTGSVLGLAHSLYRHRQLIYTLARKDILGRYKGALMGISWTLITPIFTLIIYTFIFSEIFKIRWHESAGSSSKLEFALIIFAGMIVFTFFSEIINRSTTIISSNVNYVKKVIFPLEILPAVLLLEAGFYAFISLVTLLLLIFITNVGTVNNIYFVPIIFAPFAFLCLGLSFFLASISVYMRDINQAIGSITTILMFLSPIFFPLSAVPEAFQHLIKLNPLTYVIENIRDILFFDFTLDMPEFLTYCLFSLLVLIFGYYFFQKTRDGFSDVL